MIRKLSPLLIAALLLFLVSCTVNAPVQTSASLSESPVAAPPSSASPTVSTTPFLSAEPTEELFVFTRDTFPQMDGSTSTIPLGQAVASVLLGEPRDQVANLAMFSKTTQSFRNLMIGDADILIVGEPNPAVFEEMKQAGFDYEMTAFANDALVFVVNEENPVNNLSTEQVRKIYTGEIINWQEVGGNDLTIEAFQRNAEAGSQSLMMKLVMKEHTMMPPPEGYTVGEMSGLITAVKSFDGSAAAIGYTVYYYAEDMEMAKGLKILSIDGVQPSVETIASKKYPFLNPYYTVIAASEPEGSPARIMYNWLLSPEGQNLIKTEGYVPVNG